MKKQYKVESRTFYSKVSFDKDHIAKSSADWAQGELERYAAEGWRLVSTDAVSFGFAVYLYLYFERDADG